MRLPYYPMYPLDFEGKTSHLTFAEDGAYNRLLRICWLTRDCTIPADESWIMRRLKVRNDVEKDALLTVLDEYFTIENGRYSNARLIKIWKETKEAYEKKKNAGAKGGRAKALKNKKLKSSNATEVLKQPKPEPEPYNDTIINNSIISKDALEDAPPDGGNLIDKYFDIFLSAVGKDNLSCPSDMQIFSVPMGWIVNGCNPELDIVPVLKAIAAKNPNIRSWNYFTNAVYEAKARREAKPPDIQINQASNPQKLNKTDKLLNAIDDVDGIIKNRLTA